MTTSSQYQSEANERFAEHVSEGLSANPKWLHPKFFYDEHGSKLFEKICLQHEYYLTRTECDILRKHSSDITGTFDDNSSTNIIELGSGSSTKTKILFRSLLAQQEIRDVFYYPVDISHTAMLDTATLLAGDFPNLHVKEIIGEYDDGMHLAHEIISARDEIGPSQKMVLFLGSSIGNLNHREITQFLRMIKARMDERDFMLVGFDMQKDVRILEAAYNDRAGVTASFNLNILQRINQELGGKFDLSSFEHYAFYNKGEHRIEMHLRSMKKQIVDIKGLDRAFTFEAGETIHTENSYKYTPAHIEKLVRSCGLEVTKHYMDDKKWFDLCLIGPT